MNIGVLMAAGRGMRMGECIPKQFLLLENKPVFVYSLEVFEKSASIHSYILMVPEGYVEDARKWTGNFQKLREIVIGGKTRHETSLIALKRLESLRPEIVVFHDSARPFITINLVEQLIAAAKEHGASTAAIRISDTVAYCENSFVKSHIPRENLYRILTPQAFRYDVALKVFEMETGDDGTVPFLKAGLKVSMVLSDMMNFKITYPEDFRTAQFIARFWDFLAKSAENSGKLPIS